LRFKASLGNSSCKPHLKNPSQKRAGGVAQGADPEFKSQYYQKKRLRKESQMEDGIPSVET
jgi:hypothetical protein